MVGKGVQTGHKLQKWTTTYKVLVIAIPPLYSFIIYVTTSTRQTWTPSETGFKHGGYSYYINFITTDDMSSCGYGLIFHGKRD